MMEVEIIQNMEVEIIQNESDTADRLKSVVAALNERFTTREQMEFRFEVHCESVARQLGAQILFKAESVLFNFTGMDYQNP